MAEGQRFTITILRAEQLLYAVLAAGRHSDATAALHDALKTSPKIGNWLLKHKPRPPKLNDGPGVIMTVNLSIGTVTPPLGVDLFVASTITNVSLEAITIKIWPYILMLIADLLLISFVPPLSMTLVGLLG